MRIIYWLKPICLFIIYLKYIYIYVIECFQQFLPNIIWILKINEYLFGEENIQANCTNLSYIYIIVSSFKFTTKYSIIN